MTPKQSPPQEILEPLRQFLETLTQELTEQKFIPAFRDELRSLLTALENLQHSEESLQQISRGVDRLRELFAPASNRLLDGVKEIESLMKGHTGDLKDRSTEILRGLEQTHDQLQSALRSEGELLREQSGASREALSRVSAEMESRFTQLTSQLDSIFRKFESEAEALRNSIPNLVEPPPYIASAAPQVALGPVQAVMGDDVREALQRTESVVLEELRRYRKEIEKTSAHKPAETKTENWDHIQTLIQDALSSAGSRVSDEFESHFARLRDQFQVLVAAQSETRSASRGDADAPSAAPAVSPEVITTALHAAENRIVQEFSQSRKSLTTEFTGARRAIQELEKNLADAAGRQADRLASEVEHVRDSLSNLDRLLKEGRESDRASRESISALSANVHGLHDSLREQAGLFAANTDQISKHLEQQTQSLGGKFEEDQQRFTQVTEALARMEQAATAATDMAVAEGRAQRDRIESGLRELRTQIESSINENSTRTSRALQEISQAWTGSLEQLRAQVENTLREGVEQLSRRMSTVEGTMSERDKSRESFEQEMVGEVRRGVSVFDEKFETLKTSTATFSSAVEGHVKAVASEVSALRARQDQQLSVLREAIRANYDENAARLKEVIESGTDHFLKQASSIPQALERYTHLIQSLHQGDQIALQAIASDAKNLVSMSSEKFEVLQSDTGGMKKLLPLLDRKLEKLSTDLEHVRKAQAAHDKSIAQLSGALNGVRETTELRSSELHASVTEFEQRTAAQFNSARESAEQMSHEIRSVQDDHLPEFKRDLAGLLGTKFDFMESTTLEREQSLRNDLLIRMDEHRRRMNRALLLIGLLGTLGIVLQFSINWMSQLPK